LSRFPLTVFRYPLHQLFPEGTTMTPECTHTLPNGQKCRGAALHHQEFCRHHAPSSVYTPSAVSKRHSFTPRARWRAFGRQIPVLDASQMHVALYQLLESLTDPDPSFHHSDLVVGRNLRLLLSRLGHVPFPAPGVAAPAPSPAPPQTVPQPRPALVRTPSQLDDSELAPDVRAALKSIAQDSTPESFDALMAALAKGNQQPNAWSRE
jgi:hypothetical protein